MRSAGRAILPMGSIGRAILPMTIWAGYSSHDPVWLKLYLPAHYSALNDHSALNHGNCLRHQVLSATHALSTLAATGPDSGKTSSLTNAAPESVIESQFVVCNHEPIFFFIGTCAT